MSRTLNNQKPELILKRVNDFINTAVGTNAEKEKRIALDQLHAVVCVKRKNAWSKSYEALMKRHLELCVDLKDHLTAKDGLHQYRNLCITNDPSSLEAVILHLMELSETRATLARQKADKVSLAAANRVADLDQEESPESIMLSSMTEEGVKERTDREVVIPWLRFLWENYRATLELLYRLPKLDKVYHRIAEKAFKFCEEYSRMMELRRLCDMLRQQLNYLQKSSMTTTFTAGGRSIKTPTEWTSESTEYHLQTRFAQLEVVTKFELWNEAFRTIEDINGIIAFSKKTPKAKLMVTYYEKLTRIFAVADNKLFHAYACLKFYQWTLEAKKDLRPEEKTLLASIVVLASLAVPSINEASINVAVAEEEETSTVDKSSQLATLLDFQANPSRQLLLYEIVNLGLLDEVFPEMKSLYETFEVKFLPLKFIPTVIPLLETIRGRGAPLNVYAEQLEKMSIIRVVQQLSRVYNTVKIDFLYKLFTGLQCFSPVQIEKLLLEAVANRQLNLKISHGQGIVTFQTATSSAVAIDTQVAKLGMALNKVARAIDAVSSEESAPQKTLNRRVYITAIAENEETDFAAYAERKVLIERRKEELERLQQEKAKEEKRLRELQDQRRLQDEKERQEEEKRRREAEEKRRQQEVREVQRIQAELKKFDITKTEAELLELEADSRIQLVVDAQNEALKKKEEEKKKSQNTAKQLDYFVRAQRIETAPLAETREQKEATEDQALLDLRLRLIAEEWGKKHEQDIAEKQRFARVQAHRGVYEQLFLQKQKEDYDRQMNLLRKRLIAEKREARLKQARMKAYEEAKRIEEERIQEEQRLETERLEQERYEQLRRKRQEEEERERQKEAERQRQEEERQRKAAEDQRRQEEEAAARAAARAAKPDIYGRSGGGDAPPAASSRSDPFGRSSAAGERGPPPAARPDPFGGGRARDERPAPSRTASGGGSADPFDNFRRGQKLPEPEPRRTTGSGGFDSFRRSERPPEPGNEESKEGRGSAVPAAAAPGGGGGGKYVPPSARSGGFRSDEPPSRSGSGFDRKDSGRGGGGFGDRGADRGAGFGDRRPPPERKPDNRSSEGGSWRK